MNLELLKKVVFCRFLFIDGDGKNGIGWCSGFIIGRKYLCTVYHIQARVSVSGKRGGLLVPRIQ